MFISVSLSVSSSLDSGFVPLFMCSGMEMLLSVLTLVSHIDVSTVSHCNLWVFTGVVVCCWLLTVRMFHWLLIVYHWHNLIQS